MVPAESFHRWFAVFALSLFLGKTLNNLPLIFIWGSSIHHTRTLDFSLGNESLFLQHLNTHLLTLTPAPEQIKRCWKMQGPISWSMLLTSQSIRRFYPKMKRFCKFLKHSSMILIYCFIHCFWLKLLPYSLDFSLGFREKGYLSTYSINNFKECAQHWCWSFLRQKLYIARLGRQYLLLMWGMKSKYPLDP